MPDYEFEKFIAVRAVTMAADLCMRVRAEMVELNALEKGDKSPVTVADFGAQAVVCRQLQQAFPHDPVVGEEDSAELQKPQNEALLDKITRYVRPHYPDATMPSVCRWIDRGNGAVTERYWTLDPIDGTKGFLRNDQYAVALALVENGQIKVGALACPALPLELDNPDSPVGVIFVAVQGQGAEMAALHSDSFAPVRVTDAAAAKKLRFAESVESGHGDHARQQAIAAAAGITQPSLRMDSQVKYGAIARGDAALYLRLPSPKSPDYREKIWDHAAGCIIVTEAGGRVTDMHGNPLDFAGDYRMHNNRGVVVSNGNLHNKVINALTEVPPNAN